MLLLIISHGIFQLFVFKIFQAQYREEIIDLIEEGISEDELTFFVFSKDELKNGKSGIQWMEEDEFRFDDEMYDIVKTETKGDSIYIHCIYDENESKLYVMLDKSFQQMLEDDPDKLRDLNILNNSLSQFYSKPIEIENNSALITDRNYFAELTSNLLEGQHFPVIQPPRS